MQGERVDVDETVALAVARAKALVRRDHGATRGGADAGRDRQPREAGAGGDSIASTPFSASRFQCCRGSRSVAMRPMPRQHLGDRATLLDGDDLAIAGWLPKLGCVRETTGRLADVLTAAEAMGQLSAPQDLKLLQFPRDAAARWGALPPAPDQDLRGVVAVVAHAPSALSSIAPGDTLAGLFIDEWSESIPATDETTGLGFHFDAPGRAATAEHSSGGSRRIRPSIPGRSTVSSMWSTRRWRSRACARCARRIFRASA